jgi:hypothetical protein
MAQQVMGIGDIAEGHGFTRHTDRTGMQCTVIGDLDMRDYINERKTVDKVSSYLVRWVDGMISVQEPESLRLVLNKRSQGPAWGFTGLNPLGVAA